MAAPPSSCTALVVYSGDDKGTNTSPSSNGNYNKGNQRFVGLSNQGATCYMNSLLQTLYMTPEFRTALYKWKYDPEKVSSPHLSLCVLILACNQFLGRSRVALYSPSTSETFWSSSIKVSFSPFPARPHPCLSSFLPLLSNTRSVDTIALTKSFGWEGSEVFQQQDVQELCRVLFDALEESFKGTEVEKTIDEIYAGEMVDYVKCIDIDYQSERRDKFLDCSLAIRPYGSSKSMKSLAECLEHYLEPEILDGDNKYYAESVERKVDAIKGLKFSRLPPILSVQLKRFVYDFSGDSIIQMKINDEVKFPLILDLNKYVSRCKKMSSTTSTTAASAAEMESQKMESGDEEAVAEVIDEFEEFLQKKIQELRAKKSESNAGLGTVDPPPAHTATPTHVVVDEKKGTDWNSGKGSPASLVCEDDHHLESKDDLDVPDLVDYNGNLHPDLAKAKQTAPVGSVVAPAQSDGIEVNPEQQNDPDPTLLENVNLKELVEQRGEWIYELYAVLVHSGAISGGHYYVYIKDIETSKWWNFNDSYVDEISVAKVLQASGGIVQQTSYYGVKSQVLSSANAYMLMYRKISLSQTTTNFPPNEMVPEYIKDEIQKLSELAEKRRKEDEDRFNRLPLQIYWQNKSHSVTTHRHASYNSLLQQIWTELDLFNSPEYQSILARNREVELSKEMESCALTDAQDGDPVPAVPVPVDPLVVPLDEIRLRIFYSYNKLKQDPFPVESRGHMSLEAIRITTYRDLLVELRSRYEEWEVYEPDGFNMQLLEYDSVSDDFKSPVTIRLPRSSTLKDLKNKIQSLPATQHVDVTKMRILKLTLWSLADVKIDEITSSHPEADSYRLILDLRLCEGQKIYLETNEVPLEESACVKCYTAQINRINVLVNKPGVVDEPERTVAVDRRATMKEFREAIAKNLDIEPDSFRIFRKTALESELSGDKAQTLYALGIYNGIPLHLSPGKPLLPGHYLLKLFLYQAAGRSALHDLQAMELPTAPTAEAEAVGKEVIEEVQEQEQCVEASATVVNPADPCIGVPAAGGGSGDVVVADNVTPVPETSSDATPLSVTTGTPVSLNDIDIDVLSNGTAPKSAPLAVDPFKIDEDTPDSSSSDILGFGYKMVAPPPSPPL
jgi:ubiquitin C-terminal hydrolase